MTIQGEARGRTVSETVVDAKRRRRTQANGLVDPSWKTLYVIGGVALLVEGLAYLMITAMGPMMGVPPGNTLAWLNALAAHPKLALFDYGIVTGIADLVLIPAAFALYFALKGVSKSWMLVAAGMILIYVAVDVATFVSTSIDLTWLTQNYAAATDATARAAILGAEYSALSTIPLSQFLGWTFPPFAFLIVAVAVREARFARGVPLLGYFTVLFSVAGGISFLDPVAYWQNFQLPALAVYGLFMLGLGSMLIRLGRGAPRNATARTEWQERRT